MAFDAGAVIGKMILDSSQWTDESKNIKKSSGIMSKSFGALSGAVKLAGGAIIAGLSASVMAANDFNKEFSNVATLVDDSVVDINAMQNSLLGLDNRLGSATELTKGLYQTLSASVEPTKAIDFVADSAKFAKAALVDTNTAVDVISTTLNAYGREAEDASNVSDILFTTIKNGKITGEELSGVLGDIIPSAAKMNLSFENVGASIAEMTKQGINSSESTTQLNAIMTALIKPSDALSDAMKSAGFETGEAVTSSDNFQEALQQVINQTDGSNEALAELFPNVRAFKGVLALTGKGAKDYADTLEEMKNSTGATTEAFEDQELTFATLGNAVQKLAITIGNMLLPFVYAIIDQITSFVDELINSKDFIEGVKTAISFLAGAFSTLFEVVKNIVDAVITVFNDEMEKTNNTVKKSGDEADLASIGWEIFARAMGVVEGIVKTVGGLLGGIIRTIINLGNVLWGIAEVAAEVGKFISFQESDISGAFGRLTDNLGGLVNDVVDDVGNVLGSAVGAIGALFTEAREESSKYRKAFEEGQGAVKDAIEATNSTVTKTITSTSDLTVNVEGLTDAFKDLVEPISDTNDEIEEETRLFIENYKETRKNIKFKEDALNKMRQAFQKMVAYDKSLAGIYKQTNKSVLDSVNQMIKGTQKTAKELMIEAIASYEKVQEKVEETTIKQKEITVAHVDEMKEVWRSFGDEVQDILEKQILSALKDIGKAFMDAEDGGKSFMEAIGSILMALVDALPQMLLSAGLQAIAMGQVHVGIGLVAASGIVAIGAGVLEAIAGGELSEAQVQEIQEVGEEYQQEVGLSLEGAMQAQGQVVEETQEEITQEQFTAEEIMAFNTVSPLDVGIPESRGIVQNNTFTGDINQDVDIDNAMLMAGMRLQNSMRAV